MKTFKNKKGLDIEDEQISAKSPSRNENVHGPLANAQEGKFQITLQRGEGPHEHIFTWLM